MKQDASRLWPAGLVAAFILFFGGMGTMIYLSTRQPEDLVHPDYYEQELRHQARMDSTRRTEALAEPASVFLESESRTLIFRFPPGAVPDQQQEGTLTLFRPSDASQDRAVPVNPGTDGRQSLSLEGLPSGKWRIKASWTSSGLDYYYEETLHLP